MGMFRSSYVLRGVQDISFGLYMSNMMSWNTGKLKDIPSLLWRLSMILYTLLILVRKPRFFLGWKVININKNNLVVGKGDVAQLEDMAHKNFRLSRIVRWILGSRTWNHFLVIFFTICEECRHVRLRGFLPCHTMRTDSSRWFQQYYKTFAGVFAYPSTWMIDEVLWVNCVVLCASVSPGYAIWHDWY